MSEFSELYPLILSPTYKDYIWGGQNILKTFNRALKMDVCAESWEASDRNEGPSLIENGFFKGKLLKDLIDEKPHFFGSEKNQKFPLLIKLIDAHQDLSIQVHPNSKMAALYGGEAKSEMWHILDALKGSKIYLGFKKNLSFEEILKAIEVKKLQEYMNEIEVKKGETYFIPAGLIHSIGRGCLIYEVQQNSNTTYRLYDWGRQDKNGAYRKLHLKEAFEVMNKDQVYSENQKTHTLFENFSVRISQLLNTPYFTFNKLNLRGSHTLKKENFCRIFFVSSNDLKIQTENTCLHILKGSSFIVPACCGPLKFSSIDKDVALLETIPKQCNNL